MNRRVAVALKIWPFLFGALLVLGVNRLEREFMPVVKDFTVTSMVVVNDTIKMSGYMRKDRDCKFAGISAVGQTALNNFVDLPLRFRDSSSETITHPTGTQHSWEIEVPVQPSIQLINLSAVHTCHIFWSTETALTTVPLVASLAERSAFSKP